jgi:hypothetical protein
MQIKLAALLFAVAVTLMFTAPVDASDSSHSLARAAGAASFHDAGGLPVSISESCCGEGCNPGRSNDFETHRWVGWKWGMSNGDKVGGVYSNIWNYSPWVYPVVNNFSTSWALLTYEHAVNRDADWAQAGWLEFRNGERHTFFQTHAVGQSPLTYFDAPTYPVNTYVYYDTLEDYYPGYISFRVAGVNFEKIPDWFWPTEAQVSGETLSLADQMPGGYHSAGTYEDLFDSSYYLNFAWHGFLPGAQIFNMNQGGGDESSHFGHTNPASGNNLSIWDKACPY